MKKITKTISIIAVILLLSAVALPLSACVGTDENLNDSSILNITMPDLGYGTDWMKALAEGFTNKTGIKVNVHTDPTESGYTAAIKSGSAKYDLYLIRGNIYSMVTNNQDNYSDEDVALACLDDVYNSEIEGEGILFKDKMMDVYEIYNRIDAKADGNYHYYGVQWCNSIFGFVRNLKVWKDTWTVPNTTDEFLALCKQIKDDGCTPFIWSSGDSYVWSSANLWVTQYQGIEDMYGSQGFWNGYGTTADGNSSNGIVNDSTMWRRNGILYAMEVVDQMVNTTNNYSSPLSTQVDFTTAQGYFMIESNNIAMMSNGDWLYKEMVNNYSSAEIDMIKTPVISAIRNHPDCEGTIESDAELSALIKAIDKGSTALRGNGYNVSQSAYDKVYEARNMYTCSSNINHVMISPSYSDSLDLVKQFYLYIASEEGLSLYARSSGGFTLGFNVSEEVSEASSEVANSFVLSTEALKKNNQVAPWPMLSSRLFSVGGMSVYPTTETGYQFPELIFSLSGSGYKTPAQLFQANYQAVDAKMDSYLRTAGLK